MSEESTTFEPNDLQRQLLSTVQGAGYGVTVTDACRVAEIDRTTWYLWTHKPGFLDWWNAQREKFWSWRLGDIDKATFEAATGDGEGNHQDRRLFYERYDKGFVPASRQIKEVQVDVTSLDNRTAELLGAYLDDDREGAQGERPAAVEGAEGDEAAPGVSSGPVR